MPAAKSPKLAISETGEDAKVDSAPLALALDSTQERGYLLPGKSVGRDRPAARFRCLSCRIVRYEGRW